jgi:hypothetical protein
MQECCVEWAQQQQLMLLPASRGTPTAALKPCCWLDANTVVCISQLNGLFVKGKEAQGREAKERLLYVQA